MFVTSFGSVDIVYSGNCWHSGGTVAWRDFHCVFSSRPRFVWRRAIPERHIIEQQCWSSCCTPLQLGGGLLRFPIFSYTTSY